MAHLRVHHMGALVVGSLLSSNALAANAPPQGRRSAMFKPVSDRWHRERSSDWLRQEHRCCGELPCSF
jgi:hypothetical protein